METPPGGGTRWRTADGTGDTAGDCGGHRRGRRRANRDARRGRAGTRRHRGGLSILATLCGIAAILAFRAFRGDPPLLPAPLDRAAIHLVVAVLAGGGLILTARGLDPYYIGIGFFGLAFIVAAAALTPRLGVALFVSAVIAGQLLGALALDQLGAFGGEVRRIDGLRVAGVALLLLGVGLVRGGGH